MLYEVITEFPKGFEKDLTVEENAIPWLQNAPEAFCNTDDRNNFV